MTRQLDQTSVMNMTNNLNFILKFLVTLSTYLKVLDNHNSPIMHLLAAACEHFQTHPHQCC